MVDFPENGNYFKFFFVSFIRLAMTPKLFLAIFLLLLFPFAILGNQFPLCNYMNWSFQRRYGLPKSLLPWD